MQAENQTSPSKGLGQVQEPSSHTETYKLVSSPLEPDAKIYPTLIDLGSQPRSALVDDAVASVYLGVTPGTLSVWRSTGRYPLTFIKIGRRVRYMVGDILDFVESRIHLHTSTQHR